MRKKSTKKAGLPASVSPQCVPTPYEHDEQAALFEWAGWMAGRWPELEYMHAIPNGGDRNKVVAAKLRAEGVKAGVPDIFLPCPRGGFHGLYIEMKRTRGGRVSREQQRWIDGLRAQGYRVEVCAGFDAAKKTIEEYMKTSGDN